MVVDGLRKASLSNYSHPTGVEVCKGIEMQLELSISRLLGKVKIECLKSKV